MYVKKLSLNSFRNYDKEEFEFGKGINVLYGDNAQGKTNAVEALFFTCTGYSPRARRDKQFIKYDSNRADIHSFCETRFGSVDIKASFFSEGNKKIFVNGTEITRTGELLGNVNAVYFNPSELKLVTEAPEDRRRFMDISVSQIKRSYYYALQTYKKIILQRNNLLKCRDEHLIGQTLSVWDRQLAPVAARIICDRVDFLTRLAPKAKQIHSFLTDGKEDLQVSTDSEYSGSEKEVEAKFLKGLSECFYKDLDLGYTSIGPHRDDIKLTINGKEVKIYGSQGQMRTVALSLKLAEKEIFKERYGENPLLILDDAFSELDYSRQKKLLEKIEDTQVFITCTGIDTKVFQGVNCIGFLIDGGKVVERKLY